MKKKFFKNKIQMVTYLLIFALFLFGFVYFGTKDYSSNEVTNEEESGATEIFEKDSIFETINASDALNFIKGKNIIILFGKNNDFVKKYSEILEEVAKENNIDKIYYYDIENDRNDNNASYRSLVDYLGNNMNYFEGDTSEMYAPTFVVKCNGVIIYFDNDAAITKGKYTVDEYFNSYNVKSLKSDLANVFEEYNEGVNNGK